MSPKPILTPLRTARRLPRWKMPLLLPVVLGAEWAIATSPIASNTKKRSRRAGVSLREKGFAWVLLVLWAVVLLVALGSLAMGLHTVMLLLASGALAAAGGLFALMLFLVAIGVLCPTSPAFSWGWDVWVDPQCEAALFTDRRGRLRGFWSANASGQALAYEVLPEMMARHGRSGYQPRSDRHSRSYEKAVRRLGFQATQRHPKKPLGWWDVH